MEFNAGFTGSALVGLTEDFNFKIESTINFLIKANPMITLLNFRKKYHFETVLDIAAWQFESGIYQLRGANGSGKTTLLKAIGARLPFQGDIQINGNAIKKRPDKCRADVSYVSAEPVFPDFISGADLYHFFLKTKGKSDWRLNELIQGFGCCEFLDSPTGNYSSGMLKKLALLLAFTGRPKWILLDEPYNGLDVSAAAVLSEFIIDLRDRFGVGFLMASHQQHKQLLSGTGKVILVENAQLNVL